MNKPLLLWDFDGVMADSTEFVFSFWRDQMKRHGIDFKLSDYQATFTHKFPFEYLAENYPRVAHDIKEKYSTHEEAHFPKNVPAFNGFKEKFIAIAPQFEHHVISSNLKNVIEPWLTIHGLRPHFNSVVGREAEGYKDQKINRLLSQLSRQKNEAIFIGDTISDIQHAQAASIKNIAVSWGVHNHKQLLQAQPDVICDSVTELFTHLSQT